MTYFNKIQQWLTTQTANIERSREINRVIRNTRLIAGNMEPSHTKKIPGMVTKTFMLDDYRLIYKSLIRGDLYEYTKTKDVLYDPLVSYGDQTRAYNGLRGLCNDNLFGPTEQLKELNAKLSNIITNNYQVEKVVQNDTTTCEL